MDIIILQGEWETKTIRLDGEILSRGKSQKIWNHSPTGFNWGFQGSGCAQLALAILLEHLPEREAVWLHQNFKRDVIAALPQADFLVSINLREWIGRKGEKLEL
jgi:hypothetical protein